MIELSSAEVVPALLDGVGIGICRRPILIRCWETEVWCRCSVTRPSARRRTTWCSHRRVEARRRGRLL